MFEIICWSLFGYFLGSIPFAIIFGQLIARKDIRRFGDGNPGGTNALKAGGLKAGVPAILLDISKGTLPIFLAQHYGISEWGLIPVALSPVLGHACSVFLRFQGGKALGTTGGIWLGLIGLWAFPAYCTFALPFSLIQNEDGWSACAGMVSLLGFVLFFGEPWMVSLAALNTAVIFWLHRRDLRHKPQLRQWVTTMITRRDA
jgi:glycerol-3-phosphate acyltransferase PlsY